MRKELAISPSERGSASDKRERLIDVVFHEAFHQYIFYVADEYAAAVWFNEGNACYFQGIDFISGEKAKIEPTSRCAKMKEIAVSGKIKVEDFIQMKHVDFYAKRDTSYPFSWGLMFFLHKGAPVMKDKNKYSEIPGKYFSALLELRDGDKATAKA
ncbi:MAG TPA: hypothetical protein DET40_25095 [Lentisphaeria bacterium]|nr:MAG: hypothetical protein A2X45_18865 [Lentisphaerae bacterium GWF2_50_93]HCE46837.1 hypothetical protein [Lentisphaeria bacterium]